jgi:hypothetical protein
MDPTFLPQGSDGVARWALGRRLGYAARPDESWFRQHEPFDTMVAPAFYFNACSWSAQPGSITLVEPWTEDDLVEPMDRTLLAFAQHPGLYGRASMRSEEHFITRVSVLSDPPPPKVALGDPVWDEHVVTHAPSVAEAQAALTPALRALLQGWGFRGHLELRPGAAILHYAGLKPTPADYERLSRIVPQVVTAALTR